MWRVQIFDRETEVYTEIYSYKGHIFVDKITTVVTISVYIRYIKVHLKTTPLKI